jgi:hypothetical protein
MPARDWENILVALRVKPQATSSRRRHQGRLSRKVLPGVGTTSGLAGVRRRDIGVMAALCPCGYES